MSTLPTSTAHKRPVAVTVVGLITLVAALVTVAIVLLALGPGRLWQQALSQPLFVGWRLTASGEETARAAGLLISGGVTFALSLGLFGVRRWAWLGLMTWTGANLAFNLIRYRYGRPDYVALLLGAVIVFSLNLAEVQEAFGIRRRADDSLEHND